MKRIDSITIRCTQDLKQQLQKIAANQRWTLSQTVNIILEEYLEKLKAGTQGPGSADRL